MCLNQGLEKAKYRAALESDFRTGLPAASLDVRTGDGEPLPRALFLHRVKTIHYYFTEFVFRGCINQPFYFGVPT